MSKKILFERRGHFDNRHAGPEEPLLKSGRRHVYHICWCLWRQLGRKKSLLLICKLLKLFLKALAGRDKYSFRNRDNLQEPFHMQLSQKQELFSVFFCFFFVFEIYIKFWTFCKKKNNLIADLFPKLRTPKKIFK